MTHDNPGISAVVLAAGRSRRMGEENKLLLPVGGRPMVARVVEIVRTLEPVEIIVVTGHEEARVRAALAGAPVRFAHNPVFSKGMASSICTGVEAARKEAGAFMICLGDMPAVQPDTLLEIARAHRRAGAGAIVTVQVDGRRGHPVLFDARYRAELSGLEGDAGARSLIERHRAHVVALPVGDDGVLVDLDTPEAYRRWLDREGGEE